MMTPVKSPKIFLTMGLSTALLAMNGHPRLTAPEL